MGSNVAGTCEADVFDGHPVCDEVGTELYLPRDDDPDGAVLLCLEHFGEVSDGCRGDIRGSWHDGEFRASA